MKVLITGAAGCIGGYCVKALKGKYDLYGTYFSNKRVLSPDVSWHHCDILDTEAVGRLISQIKPDMLLHLAWGVGSADYMNDYNNIDWPKASFSLVRDFYENGGKRAVIAGTLGEYDSSYGIMRENITPDAPLSIYGLSKKYAYDLINLYTNKNNLSMAWGRIFYLYGANERSDRLFPHVVNSLINNEEAVCSSGEQVRDYLYAADVAGALSLLLESDCQGIVNICSNKTTKIKDLVYQIANVLGKPELIKLDPSRDRDWEAKVILGDNSKLKSLGWTQKYSLAEGINEAIEYHLGKRKL